MEVQVSSPIEREWRPTVKQKQFISLPFSIKEGLYGGSAGSGKSEILLLLPLIYNFHQHPLYKGIILRRTFPELESEIILRSKEWYPHVGGVYNESKKRWTFPSGAVQAFGHAEREEDVRKYDTVQYNYLGWDESTSFTGFQYEYLSFSRVRSRTSDLPAIIRSATNPGNIGHQYFRKRFVDPWKSGGKILIDDRTKLKRIFIQALITDNPHILAANPEYVAQLESLPEAERRAKLLGDWYTYTGQVFNEFRLEPLPGEPDNAQHVIEPFDIPDWWPRIVAIDWGFTAMTWIGWGAISPTGRVYIYKEYAHKEKKHEDWISDFINETGKDREYVRNVMVCHSASQQRGEHLTILQKLQTAITKNKFNCRVGLGTKGRVAGKMNLHEYLRWEKKPNIVKYYEGEFDQTKADQIYRLYGPDSYQKYLNVFLPEEDEAVRPKLQIFNTCKNLIEAIPACIYNDVEGRKEDVREFEGDDPYDGVRILLDGVKDYMVNNAKELHQLKESEDAMVKLAGSGNQTSFYRRMEHLESKSKKTSSIRRKRYSMR